MVSLVEQNRTIAPRDNNAVGTERSVLVCDSFAKGWCAKGNSCRFLHLQDSFSWEPSTPFQPSFPLTQSLLSSVKRINSILDVTEQSKPGEVHSILSDGFRGSSKCLSFEQSLGQNIANQQNYGNGLPPLETGTAVTGHDMAVPEDNVKISKDISRDPKSMTEFRLTLIEKVKQVLRPIWHEGKLSKKAHNKIVKKTADRTMGMVKKISSTPESADRFSSPEDKIIAKWVKHYMEKYGKQ
ncbi:zinc finger CCCH domain-containing protein 36-like [Apium graveolens]|uniref:zinc finger CCCH domain-containing protein 36-like n=1 Tax=Apium graveolens TaxID=4045 RepID=UPI003D7A84D2